VTQCIWSRNSNMDISVT